MKRKHSIPAFFFLYHPDRDSREFAALARKEGYDRILLLRRENPFVANLHPIQAESERSIWAVYLMDFRRPATHSSDAWNCEEAAKTLDCNIRIELSLPANATVSAVYQALKYCYSTRSVSDARTENIQRKYHKQNENSAGAPIGSAGFYIHIFSEWRNEK